MIQIICVLLILPLVFGEDISRQPVYKYRYESEDVMKTAASNVPLRGYHVVEGGYYPSEGEGGGLGFGRAEGGGLGFGRAEGGGLGFGRAGYIGGPGGYSSQFLGPKLAASQVIPIGGTFGGQVIPQYTRGGYLGGGAGFGGFHGGLLGGGLNGGLQHHFVHPIGGEEVSKEQFSGEKKNVNGEKYEKSEGKKGEEVNHGKSGYAKGEIAAKDVKGDSGFYTNIDGEKKVYEDGKEYHGGQHYDKEGKSGEEKTAKEGHKKGHKIKSFKNSHHKDESGKSEEYYDEAHDEGGNVAFNGQSGSFGESGATAFKGGNQDAKYNSAEAKKEGHFENKNSVEKVEGDLGKYGENKFAGNEAIFGYKNGADEQSLLGHQESNKYFKAHPFVVPFYQP